MDNSYQQQNNQTGLTTPNIYLKSNIRNRSTIGYGVGNDNTFFRQSD